jgi:GNAT superfamily N-acetyltransferase
MPVTIRPLGPLDFGAWRGLWTGYLTFYRTELPDEVYAATWERLLGDAYFDPRGLIAEQDGEPVGLVHYLFQRHGWRVENVTYLQDLFVKPEVRGRGVGRALIESVYAAADDAGCPSVYWTTEQDNDLARRLYDRVASVTKFIKYQR